MDLYTLEAQMILEKKMLIYDDSELCVGDWVEYLSTDLPAKILGEVICIKGIMRISVPVIYYDSITTSLHPFQDWMCFTHCVKKVCKESVAKILNSDRDEYDYLMLLEYARLNVQLYPHNFMFITPQQIEEKIHLIRRRQSEGW